MVFFCFLVCFSSSQTRQGKSTLVLALFRLITQRGGCVLIDGLDISRITLRALRSALSVIPQDPLLFHSSVRTNLDPYLSVSESRLWQVLDMVQLKEVVAALPGGLDFVVSDSGENFSLGQRQLSKKKNILAHRFLVCGCAENMPTRTKCAECYCSLSFPCFVSSLSLSLLLFLSVCLARALVRGSKIVVMDEATAALDFETDQLMRKLVQLHFKDCTVLTIAHRSVTNSSSSSSTERRK